MITNLIVLAITIITNVQPGSGEFRLFKDHIVGIRDVTTVIQDVSIGYMDGTNAIEIVAAKKLLDAKTNWIDLPIVTGVQAERPAAPPAPKLLSNRETIRKAQTNAVSQKLDKAPAHEEDE